MSTGIIDGFSAACFASMCVAIAVAIKLVNDPRLQLRSDDTDIRPRVGHKAQDRSTPLLRHKEGPMMGARDRGMRRMRERR